MECILGGVFKHRVGDKGNFLNQEISGQEVRDADRGDERYDRDGESCVIFNADAQTMFKA